MGISFKAQQAIVNRKTKAELVRIEKLMNDNHSVSIKARGKLKVILDENKRAAHEETQALSKLFKNKIASIRSEAASDRRAAAKDLTDATEKMYEKMSDAQKAQLYENKLNDFEGLAVRMSHYEANLAKMTAGLSGK